MGGGSRTVEGPKKEGMSPEVVTGVLRSPVCASEVSVASSSGAVVEHTDADAGLPAPSPEVVL